MKTNIELSPRRLLLLLRNEYYVNLLPFLTVLGAFGIIMLALNALLRVGIVSPNGTSGWFTAMLYLGYIFTSLSFKEIHQLHSGIFYLTLPASVLEKFIAKLIVYSLGYATALVAAFFLFSGLVSLLDKLLFKEFAVLFNPFQKDVLLALAGFVVLQSFFLYGSVVFKKLALLKSLMILFGFFFVVGVIFTLNATRILQNVFNETARGGYVNVDFSNMEEYMTPFFKNIVMPGLKIAFWALTAPLFWVLSYFRLKRSEV